MNEKTARAVLTSFDAVRPAPSPTVDRSWKWASGVHVFPEAVCPFCKVVMRSTCLWQVSEVAQRLNKVIGIRAGRLVAMPPLHPHVHSHGAICMDGHAGGRTGRATSAAEALFLAIYPQSTVNGFGVHKNYGNWNMWFKDYWGHVAHDAAGLKKRSRPKLIKVGKARKKRAVDRIFG